MLGNSLSLRAKRNEILASNIANAATPNYKARDIDFDTEIKKYQKNDYINLSTTFLGKNLEAILLLKKILKLLL